MSECCSRSWIRQIVGRYVNGLHRCNGALGRGRDSLLKTSHISGKSGLVSDGRRNTTQKRRHFCVRLGEPENIVDEEQHILTFFVTEILCNGKTGKSYTRTSTWRLVHLPVHQRRFGLSAVELDNSSLNHFVVKIVSFTSSLTHSGKYGETSVLLGDIVDQFHNKHRLSDTGSSKKSDLSSPSVRGQQIDDFDSGDKDTGRSVLIGEGRRFPMDRVELLGIDRAALIDRFTNNVDNSPQGLAAYGNHDRVPGILDLLAPHQTLGGVHGNTADGILPKMLGNFKNQTNVMIPNLQGVENWRKLAFEMNIDNSSNNLRYLSLRRRIFFRPVLSS
mmetsp:Transcript_14070/g.56614  ORF Transcript_14070/g.56614 Transcript_14070/m.56614 type:complete len:332 (+) Transcript_14070:2420-3415(+)